MAKERVGGAWFQGSTACERRAAGDAVPEATDTCAIGGAGAGASVSASAAAGTGERRRRREHGRKGRHTGRPPRRRR
eukprot:6932378-Prymnesium_polylepis.1